jgi:membrane fusion protein (multidrug efflux system)
MRKSRPRQASLGRSQIDLNRAETLRKPGYVSEERVTTLSADAHIARSQLAKAQADAQGQRQQINALTAEIKRLDAQIANAKTDLAQAELNLTRSEIHAPISGLIGQRAARKASTYRPAPICCRSCRMKTSGFRPTSRKPRSAICSPVRKPS